MISINVNSSRKVISRCQEDSAEFTTQQSQFPTYCPDGPKELFGRPSVFGEVSKHLSRHKPQGTHVCIDVRTAQRTTTPESICLHKCPNSKLKAANSEHCMQSSRR